MRLLRFRIRTLMIAVAVAGIALGGSALWRRAEARARQARALGTEERRARQQQAECWQRYLTLKHAALVMARSQAALSRLKEHKFDPESGVDVHESYLIIMVAAKDAVRSRDESRRWAQIAERYAQQRTKYERAARRPWLPVPPDRPERAGRKTN